MIRVQQKAIALITLIANVKPQCKVVSHSAHHAAVADLPVRKLNGENLVVIKLLPQLDTLKLKCQLMTNLLRNVSPE